MSITSLRLWTQTRRLSRLSCSHTKFSVIAARRTYGTHRGMDFGEHSQLLSESLNTKQQSEAKHDHVGPFQLGLSPSALRKGEKVQKWSELSTGGKVLRTTVRTTNLGVILLGAGLSALLIYCLTSELFSTNSPTVIYGDACERIKSSPRIAKYLNNPLTFHNNPPSALRPRHRNRHITSRVMVDSSGQEHMIMTFYVQGRPQGEIAPPSDSSYFESLSEWVQRKFSGLSVLSFDEAVAWSKQSGINIWDKSIHAFKYLSGAPLPPTLVPSMPFPEAKESARKEVTTVWSFAGVFSSLKGAKKASKEKTSRQIGRSFMEGEVHADLVKNKDGYFEFRYLLVDMPSSRDSDPVRVFVERGPGVRENEPVMRWVS
ncbi:hypothetical protein BYT27DRAFT_7189355 [Phlegmacium glaucopus]|nr:hypothetical protein BYT27DRAFT_7189355 [Phlegmacium glaucopus]